MVGKLTKKLVEQVLITLGFEEQNSILRMNGDQNYRTDEGNHIIDLHLHRIPEPRQLASLLNQVPGVVESGLLC